MKTAIGFLGGQWGDMIILEPTIRYFLEQNPNYNLILACHKKYAETQRLYKNYSKRIIGFHQWEGYDSTFPTENDRKFILDNKFDKVFNPMSRHVYKDWPLYLHQTQAFGAMFGVRIDDIQIKLPPVFYAPHLKHCIAISLFPNGGRGVKALDIDKITKIAEYCNKLGYKVLHLGGQNEPDIKGAIKTNTSWFESVKIMLGCHLLITGDTGMSWVASGYNFPTLGLYSIDYYPICSTSLNWQPKNINSIYLEDRRANNIDNDKIFDSINKLL